MRSVQTGPAAGLLCQLGLLAALAATVGLASPGRIVGTAYGLAVAGLLAYGLGGARSRLGPADRVTLARAILVGGVAALVADAFARPVPVTVLVSIAAGALALDAVDGRVARHTNTVSRLGARFDMEVDAFLILVLSVYVARSLGPWVLLIGLARYAFLGSSRLLPWLRASAPPRRWAKVVAAIQGVVLTVAAADLLPRALTGIALLLALTLLTESFGREVGWLWRHRGAADRMVTLPGPLLTLVAGGLVWVALLTPSRAGTMPEAFARLPLEALVVGAGALVLRPSARRAAAAVIGLVLALVLIVRVLDIGFFAVFDRPVDVLNDAFYVGPGIGVLGDSIGSSVATAVVIAVAMVVLALLVAMPLAVARLTRLAAQHRRRSAPTVVVLGLVWAVCAAFGVQVGAGGPVATAGAADLVYGQVRQLRHDLADRRTFAADIAADPLRGAAGDQLLAGLRGKDVLLVFVESYGRVAVQGSTFAPGIDAVLDAGTRALRAADFSARSAFLTSPTFGAGSWLAHASLQSGLWVDSQQRYNQLLTRDRLTLSRLFARAGWRTVFDVPANTIDWPQGARFYHFDKLYDARNVGYRGPKFGYATMPDQYVLSAFQRLELDPGHRAPVMAEIDLVSSHHPWTPLPRLVPWDRVGDGAVYDAGPARGETAAAALHDPDTVRARYGKSIEYTLKTLFSFITTHPDPDLVLIVVGDHQPHAYVSGTKAGHDVPISIIAHDPATLQRIAGWGWQDGMRPDPTAPVWPMAAFRDCFLAAYGPAVRSATAACSAPGSQDPRQSPPPPPRPR